MNPHCPLSLCFLLLGASPPTAQDADTGPRIDLLVERLEHLAHEHHVPGMGLALVTPDGVFSRGIGVADLESGRPVTPETVFEIGSVTKTFTAVLIARLAAEGKIDFDDPVREHVPYFHLKDPEADEQVTLRDLLCHRTGLTRTDSLVFGVEGVTVEDVVRQLAKAEPMAPFRQQCLYNNQMFLVAGLAAEHAGGAPYAELLDERVFDPLGMDSSTAVLSEALAGERVSSGYRWLAAEQEYQAVPTRGIALCEPAGAILSSASDMARYLSFLLARGARDEGAPLLPRGVFEDDLWEVQIGGPEGGCGLGFGVARWRGRTMIHHDGGLDGFTSTIALLPEEGIGLALLTNAEFSAVPARSIDITFATLLGEEVQEVVGAGAEEDPAFTAEELQAFTGDFDFPGQDQVWIVFVDEAGRLALYYPGQTVYELSWPEAAGRWAFAVAPHVQIAFDHDESGAAAAMTLHNGPAKIRMPRRTTVSLPSVDDVLDLTQRAIPPALIEAVSPLRIVGSVDLIHEGLLGRFEVLYQDGDHWRIETDLGQFGRSITVVDGDSGWSFTPMRGRVDMSAVEHAGAMRGAPLSTLAGTRDLYRSFRVLEVVGEGGDERTVLRAVPFLGPAVLLRIDAEGVVRRTDHAAGVGDLLEIPIETVYEDVRDVLGMRLAHRLEVRNPLTGVTRVITEEFERNVEVPATAWEEQLPCPR